MAFNLVCVPLETAAEKAMKKERHLVPPISTAVADHACLSLALPRNQYRLAACCCHRVRRVEATVAWPWGGGTDRQLGTQCRVGKSDDLKLHVSTKIEVTVEKQLS